MKKYLIGIDYIKALTREGEELEAELQRFHE